MLADTDKKKLNTDRDYLISKLNEELAEFERLTISIEHHLTQYLVESSEGNYSDSALKCRFCELDLLREILGIFEKGFDMKDMDGEN